MRTLLLAALLAVAAPPDAPTRCGLLVTDVQDAVFASVTTPNLRGIYPSTLLRHLDGPARAEAIKALCQFVKDYTESDDFKTRYAAYRTKALGPPPPPPKTYAEYLKLEKTREEVLTAEYEKHAPTMNPEQRRVSEKAMAQMREQRATPAGYRQESKASHDESMAGYHIRESLYPADPKLLIRGVLQRLLDGTADIDFDARVVNSNGRRVFVEDRYEGKSELWKRAYRAGREPTMAAREFVEAWLKELK